MATIQKRGDSYRITVSCGYDIHGKQIRHTMTWTPDPKMTPRQVEKELKRQTVLFEERIKNGTIEVNGKIRLKDFCDKFLDEYARPSLKPTTVRNNLPDVHVHSLRHTFASLQIADGVPLVAVSRQLGHAKPSTTSDIYAHVIAKVEAQAGKTFDRFADVLQMEHTEEMPKKPKKFKKNGTESKNPACHKDSGNASLNPEKLERTPKTGCKHQTNIKSESGFIFFDYFTKKPPQPYDYGGYFGAVRQI